jgi:glyoxylase-like metal-dependent hydrolase (beta-lactamase superfamily II)
MRRLPPGNGSELLAPRTWQPVPGAPDTHIFAEIRKADVTSSNSYLIQTPVILLLVDPGGLISQAEILASAVTRCRDDTDLPLMVLLTHAHVDHFTGMQMCPVLVDPEHSILAVHDTGANAIELHDPDLTQGKLLGQEFTGMPVGIHLFSGDTSGRSASVEKIQFPHSVEVSRVRDRFSPAPGTIVDRECLLFPSGHRIELYHTPGHSPDSCCIRVGRMLFIGDLLFAANPGIAGLCGWDQDDLIGSLERMLAVLRDGTIDIVCPGHGRIITAKNACTMLEGVLTDARALTDITELNSRRAEETARFAEDCMEEINELFTILAGRLYYVSHVMDELGETDMAALAGTLIDGDVLDGLLESFWEFADAHHAQDHVSIHLALKAGQVIGKLERSFMKDELARIIDLSLVTRAERLLSSYSTMLRGFTPPQEREACALCTVIESVIIGLSGPSCSDDDILASTDDEAAFSRLLLARIGTRPLLDDIRVSFARGTDDPHVLIDHDLFSDLLTYILEDLVGTGAEELAVAVTPDQSHATVTITGTGGKITGGPAGTIRGFFLRLCERAGGSLSGEIVSDGHQYTITVNLAA